MQKGNYCDAVQISQGERIGEAQKKSFEFNRELIAIAQGTDEKSAMDATEELIVSNHGLVRTIALRFRDRGVDFEDLMQIGTIGLLKAIRSFDLERGTCFSTYAVPMIFGEIRRSLRDEGPIKIGRYYKKLGIELMRAKNEIIQNEGREPHIKELAERLNVPVEEAAVAIDAMSPIASFSDLVYGDDDGVMLEDTLADMNSLEENERLIDTMTLGRAVSKMSAEWQKIVILRYYRNKTQQEVADAMGLSQVKVSREEKKIMSFLRGELA